MSENSVASSPLHSSLSHHHTEPLADSETPRGSPCLCPSTSASVFNPTARMITQITSPEWSHHQGDHVSSHQPLLCWEPYSGFLVHSRENLQDLPTFFLLWPPPLHPMVQTHLLPRCPSTLTKWLPPSLEHSSDDCPTCPAPLCSKLTLKDVDMPEKKPGSI